ncbi:hypothetical protein [Nocardioides sp. PD653]|uniref:hypothetical protein n=1 Tax=Nocardioides sp. PD653 TaxID=393303 RepID=UPI0009F0674E|nr:hypothetical protein [Nocardioides sp. PD653]GAW54716.1 Flavodoxin reductases (Ferredoxin-NADPH reductases) family 1 Vanillate O-demethylase oxidoreductase [Nocardioides sp. PD653]
MTETRPAQTPAEIRSGLLAQVEREQAAVDVAQAAHDTASEKANKAWREAQSKYRALERAKERRDAALAELQRALPKPDPEPEMHTVEDR